jgi:4-amino-4-deoxy-L-arabinose transferase-like glycosyltransferase
MVGALTLVALALRLAGPLDSGLWYDEIRSLTDFGDAPFSTVVRSYPDDNHHPFYNLFAWLSRRAFGDGARAWRLPAVLAGALSVATLLVYARRVTRRSEAWLAAALLATSFHHVWFSQNARGYTLLLLLTLVSTALWEDLDSGRGGRGRVAAYALAMALAVYTHPTAAFVAAAHLAVSLARRVRGRGGERAVPLRRPVTGVAAAAAVALLLYAPMLDDVVGFFLSAGHETAHSTAPAASEWRTAGWAVAATARSFGLGLLPGLLGLAAMAATLGVGAVSYLREAPWRFAAWALPGAMLGTLLLALGRNLWPRFAFFLSGFFVLVLVRGLRIVAEAAVRRGQSGSHARWALPLLVWLAWTALLPRAWALPKQDFEGARDHLAAIRRPGEEVATVGLTTLPYRDFYATDYVAVRSVAELAALERRASGVYVVSTLAEYLRSRRPELAAELAARGREVARFRGSVGGGDVVVLRLAPAATEPTP